MAKGRSDGCAARPVPVRGRSTRTPARAFRLHRARRRAGYGGGGPRREPRCAEHRTIGRWQLRSRCRVRSGRSSRGHSLFQSRSRVRSRIRCSLDGVGDGAQGAGENRDRLVAAEPAQHLGAARGTFDTRGTEAPVRRRHHSSFRRCAPRWPRCADRLRCHHPQALHVVRDRPACHGRPRPDRHDGSIRSLQHGIERRGGRAGRGDQRSVGCDRALRRTFPQCRCDR